MVNMEDLKVTEEDLATDSLEDELAQQESGPAIHLLLLS